MIIVEECSVNGAVYATELPPGMTVDNARDYFKPADPSSYRAGYVLEDGRRVLIVTRGPKRWKFTPADPGQEDARLAAIAAHGPHAYTYGLYPNDGGLCIACGATRAANALHEGTRFLMPSEIRAMFPGKN